MLSPWLAGEQAFLDGAAILACYCGIDSKPRSGLLGRDFALVMFLPGVGMLVGEARGDIEFDQLASALFEPDRALGGLKISDHAPGMSIPALVEPVAVDVSNSYLSALTPPAVPEPAGCGTICPKASIKAVLVTGPINSRLAMLQAS